MLIILITFFFVLLVLILFVGFIVKMPKKIILTSEQLQKINKLELVPSIDYDALGKRKWWKTGFDPSQVVYRNLFEPKAYHSIKHEIIVREFKVNKTYLNKLAKIAMLELSNNSNKKTLEYEISVLRFGKQIDLIKKEISLDSKVRSEINTITQSISSYRSKVLKKKFFYYKPRTFKDGLKYIFRKGGHYA